MKNKKNKFNFYSNKFRRGLGISILVIGAVIISSIIAVVQTNSSKEKQKANGINALNEIQLTLENNNETIEEITFEYNKLNQNTTESAADLIERSNYVVNIVDAVDQAKEIKTTCESLANLKTDLGLGTIGIVQSDGTVLACSDPNINTLSDLHVDSSDLDDLFIRGTKYTVDEVVTFAPVKNQNGNKDFFMYSSPVCEYKGNKYFAVLNFSNEHLETQLAGIDRIENVISGLSVGKDGFFFAIDKSTGKFIYFNHGNTNLNDEDYVSHGFEENAAKDGYSGYQKIDGVKYYCVAMQSNTVTYGKYLIVCAAIDQTALINKNLLTISISCFSFILVACIVYGQGMILDREIANHFILVENRVKEKIRDDKIGGVGAYTEEEIKERVRIQMEEIISKKKDNELRRKNIGFRNRRGAQRYFQPYVFNNMLPIFIIGIVAIFALVFFSQTIMTVQDATTTSYTKLNEIGLLIEENNDNTEKISEFVSSQYLSKNKLLGYTLSNEISDDGIGGAFDYDDADKDTFKIMYTNSDGDRVPALDDFGNARYSRRFSPELVTMCENNDLNSITIFDYEGYTILTSGADWTFALSKNEGDQSYEFRKIIEGPNDSYIQEYQEDDDGQHNQYIGSAFYYYAYKDASGVTRHTNKAIYDKYKANDAETISTYGVIHKHRGVIQISINQKTLESIYRIASLDYLLENSSVYGSKSYFIAFDDSNEHNVVFAPQSRSEFIGRTAKDLGISENAFSYNSIYNGFIKLNGQRCYQSYKYVDGYFLATVIPMSELTYNRLNISLFTFALSAIFIFIGSSFFTVTNSKTAELYQDKIRSDGKALASPVGFTVTGFNGKKKKTVSAYSRLFKVGWNRMTPEQKLSSILMVYLTIASFFILGVIIFAMTNGSSDSIFAYIFSNKWDKGFNLFSITEALMIILIIVTGSKILKFIVKWFSASLGARAETTGNLIISVLKYGGVLGTIFYALFLFGFDTGGLITSAGILSVVVGLGAQSLIGDILAGMFIVFEGEFRVGDIVTIGDFRGQVIEIGLRTTKLVDVSNNVKVFNNSVISSVLNMTKESSFAVVDVSIEYSEDLQKVERVLYDGFPKIRKKLNEIIEGPFYKGVAELGESAVVLRIVANCEEKDRIQLARDLNREIFLLFKENNINIPFNQITLSYLEEGGKEDEKNTNND
ncbi:MAG: mechanosensitive ion channel family protein [Bacilli bacterium]|nr:mechanosensitive ion channel family protein [Bacilli bacterium]